MDTEEGHAFIKNLAYFVRTHEKALANAQLLQRRNSQPGYGPNRPPGLHSPSSPSSASSSFLYIPFASRPIKPAKLTLTPHHLFYLLSRFQELGIAVGPMDVRLENIHAISAPTNYVSFLNQAQRKKIQGTDQGSIHSVSSIRSVVSTMSSLWSSFGLTGKSSRTEKHKAQEEEDLKYLYSAFTKVPFLKLAPDHNAPLIAGYEEFPFDSAVPLFSFKNANTLEICDVDFRQFFGWDRLADGVRSLTLRRACVDDPIDLLFNIVLDDMDKRRRRSAKSAVPMTSSTTYSPKPQSPDLVDSRSFPTSPSMEHKPSIGDERTVGTTSEAQSSSHIRSRSFSPIHTSGVRGESQQSPERSSTPLRQHGLRRSSLSSSSSSPSNTPRASSSALLTAPQLPYTKWRFLRHLSLADNGLTAILASSLLPVAKTLQSLDLSNNLFTEVPDGLASLVSLRALNLSHCLIGSLHSLSKHPLPAITALNLRGNRLASLAGIEKLLSLERLDVRENKLPDPTEVARLTGIPNMVDIYLHKNPLVKSYATYRVTIFNLFRQTPGYTQDVSVDGIQPTYSERKHLVDRAPELPQPTIIKPPSVDELSHGFPDGEPRIRQDNYCRDAPERTGSSSSHRRRRDGRGDSTKRKKATRRRHVDIVQEDVLKAAQQNSADLEQHVAAEPEQQARLNDDNSSATSDKESPVTHRSKGGTTGFAVADSPVVPVQQIVPKQSPCAPQLLRAGSDPPFDPLRKTVHLDGDRYRQKIEALRNDLGNGWLSALSDDAWENRLATPDLTSQHFGSMSPLTPPAGPIRAPSQGIVSGGRTLG